MINLIFLLGISACTINGNIDSSFSSINPKLPDQNTIIVGRDYTIELPESYCPCSLTSQSSNLTANNSNHSISATSAGVVRFDVTDGTGQSKSFELTAVDVLGTGVPALTRVEQAGTYQITLTQAGLGGLGPFEVSIYSGGGSVSATGLFTAPSSSGSTVILIRDSLGQTYNMNFDIYPTFNIGSTAPAITTGNTTTISGSGAYGGYTYTLVSGPGSVNATTGVYTPAGPGVAVIRVTDAQGISRETTITITDVLAISPSSKTVAVNNSVSFSASGGVAPLVYSIVSGGGSINSSTGVFTAPAGSGSVTVRVTDAINNTSDAVMTVNPALQISPASITLAVNNSTTFTATGGVGTYTYSIQSGGGIINTSSGAFTAPGSSGSVTVRVADTLGNTSDAVVTVNPALTLSPSIVNMVVSTTLSMSGAGGVAPYTYSIVSGGGGINISTGLYTAPGSPATVNVKVEDSIGNTANSTLTVYDILQISPTTSTVVINASLNMTSSGGLGAKTYSIVSGGGSINSSTGVFTAPGTAGTTVVRVTDSIGNTSDSTLTIQDWIVITISTSSNNYNAFTAAGSPTVAANYRFIIDSGITIGSTLATNPAFTTGSGWPVGSQLELINNGNIYGKGGSGGSGNSWNGNGYPGQNGGTALQALYAISVTNNGIIAGGGGGGGGGGGTSCGGAYCNGGGGGGGGAGLDTSSGGNGVLCGGYPAQNGGPGTLTPGTGGSPGTDGDRRGGKGGDGGTLGNQGNPGQSAYNQYGDGYATTAGGAGGAAGKYSDGNSNVIWVTNGTRLGNFAP